MTTELVSPLPTLRFVDNAGNALTGGKVFIYAAGTTTKINSYTDSTGNTPNTNPVILNSRGEANIWMPPGTNYKVTLSPSTDSDPPTNAFWTVDNLSVPSSLPSAGPSGNILISNGTSFVSAAVGVGLATSGTTLSLNPSYLRSYLSGLTLLNDGTTPNTILDIAAGVCVDSNNAVFIKLGQTFYKSTGGSWAAGAGSSGSPVNGMGQGLTVANSTWYHVFAIINGGAADVYFDTSVTAANAPPGTTAYRRLGAFLTDGSAHIVAFKQNGDEFLWGTAKNDVATTTMPSAATAVALSVPLGVKVNALITVEITAGASAAATGNFWSADEGNGSNGLAVTGASNSTAGAFNIRTNTSSQIKVQASATDTNYTAYTVGFIDTRGRFQ